jgi:hypothetical protein
MVKNQHTSHHRWLEGHHKIKSSPKQNRMYGTGSEPGAHAPSPADRLRVGPLATVEFPVALELVGLRGFHLGGEVAGVAVEEVFAAGFDVHAAGGGE